MIAATQMGLVLLCILIYLALRMRLHFVEAKVSSSNQARLKRIKFFSRIFKAFIIVYILLLVLVIVGVACGWVAMLPDHTSLKFSPHHVYRWPFEIPSNVLALAVVRLSLWIWCGVILYKLFGLFEVGKIFTAGNVLYIRFLGYAVFVDWVVEYMIESIGLEHNIEFSKPALAVVIVFIAWIMDEGRKIQEEQELTV
jgi:hypothetical protein